MDFKYANLEKMYHILLVKDLDVSMAIVFSFKNSPSLSHFKKLIRENKNFLGAISFAKASCSISFSSIDFSYF